MMIKNFCLRLLATALLPLAFSSLAELAGIPMPGADLVVQANLAKMRDASIGKELKELQKLQQELGPGNMDQVTEFKRKMQEITGLGENDFLRMAAAVKLDGISLDTGSTPDWSAMEAVVGVRLARELVPEKLLSSLQAYAAKMAEEESLENPPAITSSTYGDSTVFQGVRQDRPDEKLFFAMTAGNKVFLLGSEMGIKGAIDRMAKGEKTAVTGLFSAPLTEGVGKHDFSLLFTPTEAMRKKMREQAQNPQPGPGAMASQLMGQMKGIGLGINSAGQMDVSLVGDFGTADVARQASLLLDTQVISGIKMFASMATGGQPLPMLQTLKTTANEAGAANLNLSITSEDINAFRELMKAKAAAVPETPVEPAP